MCEENPISSSVCPICETPITDPDDTIRPNDSGELCHLGCVHTCDNCETAFQHGGALHATYSGRGGRHTAGQHCEVCRIWCTDCELRFVLGERDNGGVNCCGEWVCERCNEQYTTCENCERIIGHQDSLTGGDRTLCESCYENSKPKGPIFPHDHKPEATFYAAKGETDKWSYSRRRSAMYFGIEIETEQSDSAGDGVKRAAEQFTDAMDGLFYCKEDGSIAHGFEMVSHPATLKFWRACDLKSFRDLARNGYRSYDTTTCGMHIHVSRQAMSTLTLTKVCQFFAKNRTFISRLSRRRMKELNSWASIEDGSGKAQRSLTWAMRRAKTQNDHDSRYVAINLENDATVEFRIFRGTLDVPAIRRNIEAIHAIIAYCAWCGACDVTYRDFRRWIEHDGRSVIGNHASKILAVWFDKLMAVSAGRLFVELPEEELAEVEIATESE